MLNHPRSSTRGHDGQHAGVGHGLPQPVQLAHVARAGYKAWDRCDLTFVTLDPGTVVAGVLTQSKCPSPEVEWCRAALTLGQARALLVQARERIAAAVEAAAAVLAPCVVVAGEVLIGSREMRTMGIDAAYAVGADGDLAATARRVARSWTW